MIKRLPQNPEYSQLQAQGVNVAEWKIRVAAARDNWQELQKLADQARDFYDGAVARYMKEIHAMERYHTAYQHSLVEGSKHE